MRYQGGNFENGSQSGLIPSTPPKILVQRLLVGVCLLLMSSVFFIGAITVIGWIL